MTDKISSERILEICRRKGVFTVSWRYRDDSIRSRCNRMVREGKLKKLRRWQGTRPGRDYFIPGEVTNVKGFAAGLQEKRLIP